MKTARLTAPRIEFLTALTLSLWVVVLHLLFLFHAGPLWRDEVGTIDFAAMPTLADIWRNLQYDNFPPLFVAVARGWTLAGLRSDLGYRVLGFLVGMGALAVLWYGARQLGGKAPLLALALYAVNPLAISVGDAMRPYGLGIALNLLTLALFWKFVQSPSRKTFLWATAGAILSVQCLYQNAFFVCAFTVGAWVVALARKDRKTALLVGMIALLAALSLTPHLGNLHKARDWAEITRTTVHLDHLQNALYTALQAGGQWMMPVWLGLCAVGLAVAAADGVRRRRWNMVYSGVCLMVSAALYLVFLSSLGMEPRPWYFLLLLAPTALVIDVIFSGIDMGRMPGGRAIPALIVAAACLPTCYRGVKVRESNVDVVAAALKQAVQPGDMVLVSPWYYGVSLQRYLDTNLWTTIPPMAEIRIHRYDLMKKAMLAENPIQPLLEKVQTTLHSGHTLFVVGDFVTPPAGQPQPIYPPYQGGLDMADARYFSSWMFQISGLVQQHATGWALVPAPIPGGHPVNTVENPPVLAIHGWHD